MKSSGVPPCAKLVALGHLRPDSEAFRRVEVDGLRARRVERRDRVMLREEPAGSRIRASRTKSRRGDIAPRSPGRTETGDPLCSTFLRAWRSEVARKRGVPAYVVFHDANLDASQPRVRQRWHSSGHPRHRRQEART